MAFISIAAADERARGEARMAEALQLLSEEQPGLREVIGLRDEGRAYDAMSALLRHYRGRRAEYHFDPDSPMRDLNAIPDETHDTTTLDDILARRFTFEQETVQFAEGIDWRHKIYDPEWGFMFHRHYHFTTLVEGYRRFGDNRCMEEFAWQLREWDRQVPPNFPRSLEVAIRLFSWMRLFPVAVHAEAFDEELLAIFLTDVHAMAESLNARGPSGYSGGNWGISQGTGVLQAGVYLPELRQAATWRKDTIELLTRLFVEATSTDGVYRGQSPMYHHGNLYRLVLLSRMARISGETLSADFLEHCDRMLDFAAAYTRPDLTNAQFGDSDKHEMGELHLVWGEEFNRPDLTYIATRGREGTMPAWRSRLFREGGFGILRSSWADGPDARWMMFDFGPHGRGGLRLLSVDVAAHDTPLAVMPGRFRYHAKDNMRALFTSTPFQNTVSIDGRNHTRNPPRALAREKIDGPLQVFHAWHEGYSYLTAKGEGAEPKSRIVHERQVVMIREDFWIVADRVNFEQPAEREHLFAQNWHFEPTQLVELPWAAAFSTSYKNGNLAFIPVGLDAADSSLPNAAAVLKDGWYSPQYGVKFPAPWLAYEQTTNADWLFATVLIPYAGDDLPLAAIESRRQKDGFTVSLVWKDGQRDDVKVLFGEETGTGLNTWTGRLSDGSWESARFED